MKQEKKKNWPPKTGTHYDPEYPDRMPRCKHKTKPSEPFAREGQYGNIYRVTPAARGIPAQAFVLWEDFTSWERLTDLLP